MIMSIALRFIPTLMDELDKIILAQKSRGSELSSWLNDTYKSIYSFNDSIIYLSFSKSRGISNAMEVRGYDANVNRTSYRKLQWHIGDTMCLISIIPIAIVLLVLKYIGV